MTTRLYLIDGHALAYRTYFALTSTSGDRLQTAKGELTAGVFGFANVLLRLLEQEHPPYLAVAFDAGHSFRDEVFAGYKATRAKMPDDLRAQMERIRQLVDVFGIPRLEKEGYEADDVLGSIATQAAGQGMGVKIITGDRDLLQLVDPRIVVNLAGSKLADARDFTPADVLEYLHVIPTQVIEYKGLVGDPSDNIPGVSGIGEKTAVSLLEKYPTLEAIYDALEEIPARVRGKLEQGRDIAFLSRQLATIQRDVAITLDLETARTDRLNFAAAESLFRELEFRTLIKRIQELGRRSHNGVENKQLTMFALEEAPPRVGIPQTLQPQTIIVDDLESLDALCQELAQAPNISLDTETTSTDPMRARLVGISLAVDEAQGYYLPVGHLQAEKQLPLKMVVERLHPYLTDAAKGKVGHNLKYDAIVLERHGVKPQPLTFDTMIAAWLVDPASHSLGLKDQADQRLGMQMTHIEELIGKGKNQRSMADVAVSAAAPYAAADAVAALRLMPLLQEELHERNAEKLFTELEMPLVAVLAEMEQQGVMIDAGAFKRMAEDLQQRMRQIADQVYQHVGSAFNLNSTQQLSQVLFERLGLEPPDRKKRTASGHFSTSADVLEEMRGKSPVVDWILEYRELAKLASTYLEALPLQINPTSGRIHTSYNQTGSVTGRLASNDPNLQNIPTRTEIGRQVRNGFIAAPGFELVSIDYSQIELRIVAHTSQDQAMVKAFLEGQDIHASTAAAIYGVELSAVTRDQRRHAKAINFGLIYGMSAFGLSRSTDLTLGEAEDFVQAYFRQFPGVKKYLDGLRKEAAQQGYVETLLGRRRYFPNLKTAINQNVRAREEREAINAPIQGTAADIIKLAMLKIQAALQAAGLHGRMIMQVHDELVLECPEAERMDTVRVAKGVMESAYLLSVPLLTDAKWGKNWGEMQKEE